jgi:hemerythrin superfamily protein
MKKTDKTGKKAKSQAAKGDGAAGAPDALDVLKAQHREVEGLFAQFEDAEGDEAEAYATSRLICQKLTVHATIEEEIFYPAVREQEDMEDTVLEAMEEHLSAKRLIEDIESIAEGDEHLVAKVTVLQEQIEHHVEEEEEEMFPDVKAAIAEEERQELGARLVARTEELERELGDGNRSPGPSSRMDEGSSREEARHG